MGGMHRGISEQGWYSRNSEAWAPWPRGLVKWARPKPTAQKRQKLRSVSLWSPELSIPDCLSLVYQPHPLPQFLSFAVSRRPPTTRCWIVFSLRFRCLLRAGCLLVSLGVLFYPFSHYLEDRWVRVLSSLAAQPDLCWSSNTSITIRSFLSPILLKPSSWHLLTRYRHRTATGWRCKS